MSEPFAYNLRVPLLLFLFSFVVLWFLCGLELSPVATGHPSTMSSALFWARP
jgi:hypothetical protein